MKERSEAQKKYLAAIGENVSRYRKAQVPHLSRERLGWRAETAGETIRRIEAGETAAELDTLEAIAGGLGVSLFDLLPQASQLSPPPVRKSARPKRGAAIGYSRLPADDLRELAYAGPERRRNRATRAA